MIDLVSLTLTAGHGGAGKVSFRREKYVPKGGPDGGRGGDGGNVVIVGSERFNTLKHYAGKTELKASDGGQGQRRKKSGKQGEDLVLEVPVGTVVWLEAENEISARRREKYDIEHILTRGEVDIKQYNLQRPTDPIPVRPTPPLQPLAQRVQLVEIREPGQRAVLCQGGFGGQGNVAFKSSTNTTPFQAEYGTFGEQQRVTLELKLLADIGLIGYPNAGKSTLLSKLTRAHPKTADYPFTTIEPNLGVLNLPDGGDLVLADIPGLIEGASEGKGLGFDFLRHIENSRELLFVLFLEESVVSDEALSDQQKAEQVWQQYQHLRREMKEYQADPPAGRAAMLDKPSLVSLNKTDLYSAELTKAIVGRFSQEKTTLYPFSAITGEGLEKLKNQLSVSI